MLRVAWIVFQNEFRLLAQDRAALFMLALAPLVIITVAGLSLGSQPGSEPYSIIVVEHDHGWLARALVDAFGRDHSVSIVSVASLNEARTLVRGRARVPLCIVIPSGTSDPRMARTFDHRWQCRGECVRPVCAGFRNHVSSWSICSGASAWV
jgi:ABC-type Na+ efflux pump permease subunit